VADSWWSKNRATIAALVMICGLALFLRLYYAYPVAFPDRLYSGGSDSFYWASTLKYSFETGQWLTRDCALNYPICLMNPRPPMFAEFSLLLGWVLTPAFGWNAWSSITWVFLFSTALWGSLTIFPLYGLVAHAFSRRAGLIAGFLLAVSPANLQRSIGSNADHDAMTLFFVVTSFYFFFRALGTMRERSWVESWRSRAAIVAGFKAFFRENRETVLYALLASVAMATVALSWQGWAYAPIILMAYLLVQLLVHRLRGRDPMGLTITFALTVGPALLLAAPWYIGLGQVRTWFDVPAILFVAAVGIGVLLTVTRDYPWSIVIPGLVVGSAAAITVSAFLSPAFANAVVSGAGYFAVTKLYSTIAEAQAPAISQVILSFGWPMYFLGWMGVGLMVYQAATGKRLQTPYLFFIVWVFAASFMAQAAARFIFNASPAFAASSAYMFGVLIDRFYYGDLQKSLASRGGASRASAFRKSVEPRHVLGAVVIVLLLLPTIWYANDASIPFETKNPYDRRIYSVMPSFLQPTGYDARVGTTGSFYLGAFGWSVPEPKEYYPAGWGFLRSQDTQLPLLERPAYLSWWDYGFEAVDAGEHPTVADNFQNGFQFAGNFLAAQNESATIALLNLRLLQGDFARNDRAFSPAVIAVLNGAGLDASAVLKNFRNPGALIPVVQSAPYVYGFYNPDLTADNALYIYETHSLTGTLSLEQLVQLYHAMRDATGSSIRYFAVDSRLFPQDASNTGIFYAPMTLSDQRVATTTDGRVIPTDFYRIYVTANGVRTQIQNVQPGDSVTGTPTLEYQPMFYNSMFYRAYIGFSPREAGSFANGIPGFPQQGQPGAEELARMVPVQGWNLKHWRPVYKTAYYNPYTDVANHTGDFIAVAYDVALEYSQEIANGTRQGQVDLSPASLIQAGVVFLKYYDGALVSGTVTVDGVTPVPGLHVTVFDDQGVPHDFADTDTQGRYSVVVPFGQVTLAVSRGTVDPVTMVGTATVNTTTLTITDDQAMRLPQDVDGNGVPDWLIQTDIVLKGYRASGTVFLDPDGDRRWAPRTEPAAGRAVVTLSSQLVDLRATATASASGGYLLTDLVPGPYNVTATFGGRDIVLEEINVPATDSAIDLGIPTITMSGGATLDTGAPAAGATVSFLDLVNGTRTTRTAGPDGRYSFPLALPGNYTLTASLGELRSEPVQVAASGTAVTADLTLIPLGTVRARIWVGGNPQGFASLTFLPQTADPVPRVATANGEGLLSVDLPPGTYSVSGRVFLPTATGSALWTYLGTTNVEAGRATEVVATFVPGITVQGSTYSKTVTNVTRDTPILFRGSAGLYLLRSGVLDGSYLAYLPPGTYHVQAVLGDLVFLGTATFSGSTVLDLPLGPSTQYTATVFRDVNGDSQPQAGEAVAGARVLLSDPEGRSLTEFTDESGGFRAPLPPDLAYAMSVSTGGFATASFAPATIAELRQRPLIPLTATNVTVSGLARFHGTPPGAPIPVRFVAAGGGGVSREVPLGPGGAYSVPLAPGSYTVAVDEDVVPGMNGTRWQLADPVALAVGVGEREGSLDLTLVQRHRVIGNVTRNSVRLTATVRFFGPDVRELAATGGRYVVYLRPGVYNASATAVAAGAQQAFLGATSITAPASVNIAVVPASLVSGQLLVNGVPLSEVAPIAFARAQGGVLTAESGATGAYGVSLPPGDYTITVDHPSTAVIGGAPRHVVYTGSQGAQVGSGGADLHVDLSLVRSLDNVTVSGVVRDGSVGVAAAIRFTAESADAMNGTAVSADDGTFSAALQPGTYGVYAVRGAGDRVFLGNATFAPRTDATLPISLGPGFPVTGVTTYRGGARVSATITFSGVASVAVTSNVAGGYTVLLPPGTYAVSASTTATENGLAVRYETTASLNVTALPAPLNLELRKQVSLAVTVLWDPAQRREIAGGGSVTYTVTVRNDGNVADTYDLTGTLPSWLTFPQSSVALGFGGVGNQAVVPVVVHPPLDALVNHPPLTITATSRADPSAHASVDLEVDVTPVHALRLNATAPRYDGAFLNFTVAVANPGNVEQRVDVVLVNQGELDAVGWVGRFVEGNTTVPSIRGLTVPANSTTLVVLAFRAEGGPAGAQAVVVASSTVTPSLQADTEAGLAFPALEPEGSIVVAGPLIATEAGIPYQLLAVVLSAAAVIGATAFVTLRRRRRRGR